MSSNPDAVVAPRHLFLLDACAAPAADLVKAALLQSCRAVFPTATPHVIAADSGVERQRLCIYTATRSVASILDTAVAADYICFVVHVNNNAQYQTYEPTSSLTLLVLMVLPLLRPLKTWTRAPGLPSPPFGCRCGAPR